MIPLDPIGYAVSADGTIHTRYATHGNGTRTRTEKGVLTLLDGREPKTCPTCYPNPHYKQSPQAEPQKRRVPRKRKASGK